MKTKNGTKTQTLQKDKEVAKLNAQDPEALNKRGNKFFDKGNYKQALQCYKKAIEILPTEAIYYSNMGDAYGGLVDLENAIKSYEKALDRNWQDDRIHNSIGITYSLNGEHQKAIEHFIEAIKITPNSTYALNIGDVYKIRHEWDEAIDYYLEAVEIDPKNVVAYNILGLVY